MPDRRRRAPADNQLRRASLPGMSVVDISELKVIERRPGWLGRFVAQSWWTTRPDAILVQFGRVRNLPRPLSGVSRIAAFFASASKRTGAFETRECELNGLPAALALREGRAVAALLLSIADGKIRHVFIHADPAHLGRIRAAAN